MDTSEYFIIKKEYTNLPMAILEKEGVTESDIEVIKEKLIPRIAGMIGQWA